MKLTKKEIYMDSATYTFLSLDFTDLDLKNDIIQLRIKGTLQKFFVGVIVKTNNGNRYVHNFKFKVNEKDEIVLY